MRDADVAALRAAAGGAVLTPADEDYEAARAAALWNGDIGAKPAAIARPTTAARVATVLSVARDAGLDVTVRGGGHSFAGHAAADGAVMIDLGAFDAVEVDPETRTVRAGGGACLAQLDAATAPHALGVPGGTVSHTGVGGLTLGGGFGWLTRAAGLTIDHMTGAEVVTADGRVVTASAEQNPDLFWALRGGGGNFGIVTTFEFDAIVLPPMVNLGLFFWTPQEAAEPLRFVRDYLPTLPPEFGVLMAGLSAPPAPFVPPEYQHTPGYAVLVAGWGSTEEHALAVAPLRAQLPTFEFVTPMPFVELQRMLDGAAPWGILGYEKAHYLRELPDEAIDTAIAAITRRQSPMSITPIFPVGGAFTAVDDDATAFGGRRDEITWVYNIAAIAPSPEMLAADRQWVRDLYAALEPYSAEGTYVNFADASEQAADAYGAAKYRRLAGLKRVWDPDNVFRHNANIKPAVAV